MRPFGLPALLLVCACAHAAKPWEPFDTKGSSASSGAARVVLLSSSELQFSIDPSTGEAVADETVHVRVKALQVRALPPAVGVNFDHTFHERPHIRARVLFPDGTTRELDPEEQWDRPVWPNTMLYLDVRQLSQAVPSVPRGGVLEYETRQRTKDLKPLQFSFPLGGPDPVSLATYSVTIPDTWEIEWGARALGRLVEEPPAVDVPAPGLKRYTWKKEHLAAQDREPFGIDPDLAVPTISVRLKKWVDRGQPQTAFASPREMSAWMWEQTKDLAAPDAAMRATVDELLKGVAEDPREKARRLYEYACERVQYCGVEIGYGGWFPHRATDVHANKYGDCKDKANYLKGLLAIAGIPSRSTRIFHHDGLPKPFGLPSLVGNFNHVILTVDLPGGPLLVDPTARHVAFGDLPDGDREADVLPISEGGADLTVTPPAVPAEHRADETYELALKDDGSATGTFALTATGSLGVRIKDRLQATMPVKHRDVISDWLALNDARVTEVAGTSTLNLHDDLKVTGGLELVHVALLGASLKVVRLSTFVPQWLPEFEVEKRRTPLVLTTRFTRRGTFRLKLPGGLKVKQLPPAVEQSTAWVDYRLKFRTEGDVLVAEREAVLKQRIIPVSEVEALRAALDAVHLADNASVLLEASR
jgi:transglutaminase-like putative cysteine protease